MNIQVLSIRNLELGRQFNAAQAFKHSDNFDKPVDKAKLNQELNDVARNTNDT